MRVNKKRLCIIGIACLILLVLAAGIVFILTMEKNAPNEPPATQSQQDVNPEQEQVETPEKENVSDNEQTETDVPEKENSADSNPSEDEKTEDEKSEEESEEEEGKPVEENPEEETSKPEQEETVSPPVEELPPVVEIPSENETVGLQFPCEVPGHNLKLEKLALYSGLFVEDGTNRQVADVAMLMVYNSGDSAIEYMEITVEYQDKTLSFQITALPAGERMVVQEKSGNTIPEGKALRASALVVHRTQMDVAKEVSVKDNGDNSLTIKNLTDETLPAVRVFYKYYMEEENLFVGGIAFTVRITGLSANGSVVVRPSHYSSQTSRVVMALIYDEA